MSRLTRWLCVRYLPAFAYEKLAAENAALAKKLEVERQQTARLTAYIRGMREVLRSCGTNKFLREVQTDGCNYQGMGAGMGS